LTFRKVNAFQVGTFMKTPKFPVWLVQIDEHYTVLYCPNKELVNDWKAERHFDLFYYDALSKSDENIRLSIGELNKQDFVIE